MRPQRLFAFELWGGAHAARRVLRLLFACELPCWNMQLRGASASVRRLGTVQHHSGGHKLPPRLVGENDAGPIGEGASTRERAGMSHHHSLPLIPAETLWH